MYTDYRQRSRPHKRSGCCLSRIILFIIFTAAAGYACFYYFNHVSAAVISPIAEESKEEAKSVLNFFTPQKNPDDLREMIKQQIGNTWNNYSVYIVDFNSKFAMGINESTIFTGASINKVPILAAIYAEAKKGKVDFDKVITLQKEDIQDYGTGSIRYDPPGTTYSVKTLTQLMMQKSDNTAAHLLALYIVGLDTVQKYVDSWGMTQTDMADNKTSNRDMAILFKKIINREITTPALSDEMTGFLKDSDFEDRLPALLPKDATVYHKIGTGTGAVHDVGVVTRGNVRYYIGIFTSDITDEEQASALAAKVSRVVFDFMDK